MTVVAVGAAAGKSKSHSGDSRCKQIKIFSQFSKIEKSVEKLDCRHSCPVVLNIVRPAGDGTVIICLLKREGKGKSIDTLITYFTVKSMGLQLFF